MRDNSFISSDETEESAAEDEQAPRGAADGEQQPMDESPGKKFVVRELQWRSEFLNRKFKYLDRKSVSGREGRRMGALVPRLRKGNVSSRDEPSDAPDWTVKEFAELGSGSEEQSQD